jgi:hypothetical protein
MNYLKKLLKLTFSVSSLLLILNFICSGAFARGSFPRDVNLVSHPLIERSLEYKTPKIQLGAWGETIARGSMKSRGVKVFQPDPKIGSKGIDALSIKKDASGNIKQIKLSEVKTRKDYLAGEADLTDTKTGKQMSNRWVKPRLTELAKRSDEVGDAARFGLLNFDNQKKVSKELISYDVLNDKYKVSNITDTNGKLNLSGVNSDKTTRVLKDLSNRSSSSKISNWAKEQIADYDKIKSTIFSDKTKKSPKLVKKSNSDFAKKIIKCWKIWKRCIESCWKSCRSNRSDSRRWFTSS